MRNIGCVLLVGGCFSSSPATYETTPEVFVDHRTGPPGQQDVVSTVPALEPGEPLAGDDIDLAATRLRARTYQRDFLECYKMAIDHSPSFTPQGTATAMFVVKPTGKLAAVRVVGFDAEFDACLVEKLGDMEFPAPLGGKAVHVTLPLRFYTANG